MFEPLTAAILTTVAYVVIMATYAYKSHKSYKEDRSCSLYCVLFSAYALLVLLHGEELFSMLRGLKA